MLTSVECGTEAPQLQPYLRDVQDHLLLVNEEVAAQRDLLGTVLEANMAVISVEQTKVSVRQNATIEQLTILATVFLPLTFVTGFFSQKFSWLIRISTASLRSLSMTSAVWPCRWCCCSCGCDSAGFIPVRGPGPDGN